MKIKSLISSFIVLIITGNCCYALNGQDIYTVITNPGEDASTSIRLNWHSNDSTNGENRCRYTTVNDSLWSNAFTITANSQLCTIYDSIYSKTHDNKDFTEDAKFIRNTVELNNLKPDTRYMYRLGNSLKSRCFKTAPENNHWTAAIISDIHTYTPLPARAKSAMAMLDTLEQVNGHYFDLILHAGDIIAWGGSYSFWRNLYDNEPFEKYVWAGVNGNHDNMSRGYARQSNDFFRFANNNPLNGYDGETGVCYHFTYGNTLFVMLNNESMRDDEGLEQAQEWVRKVIKENRAQFIIVMEHYQWFYATTGESSQYDRWKQLFDECGVDLAIAANNHIYARTNALFNDTETDGTRGTVYIQTPSADNERGQALKEWTHNTDIIKYRWSEGPQTIGALLLHATDDNLTITLHDRHGNTIDTVTVRKKKIIR